MKVGEEGGRKIENVNWTDMRRLRRAEELLIGLERWQGATQSIIEDSMILIHQNCGYMARVLACPYGD